jgi:hypothetical protein
MVVVTIISQSYSFQFLDKPSHLIDISFSVNRSILLKESVELIFLQRHDEQKPFRLLSKFFFQMLQRRERMSSNRADEFLVAALEQGYLSSLPWKKRKSFLDSFNEVGLVMDTTQATIL